MPEDFNFILKSASSLMMTPQEGLKDVETDLSSLFGDYDFKSDLKGIPLHNSDENLETPFSYNKFMSNVFDDEKNTKISAQEFDYDDEFDDDYAPSKLQFEC